MNINEQIAVNKKELIALRRDFHQHPELGLQEYRTGDKVATYLSSLGMNVTRLNVTGVCGLLEGKKPGPTLLLRADMDALPIQEETEVPFCSINPGVMHACGHDAHTAMLLIAARILSGFKDQLNGNIKFAFQPNEENVGALAMIEQGLLENPAVDACFGLHVWTPLETGQIGLTSGPIMAGMDHFDLVIKGCGGHTAAPYTAVDPILAASSVIQGIQQIQTREIDPLTESTIIMFGKIQGGTMSNVIPDTVTLSGTMRFMFDGPKDSPDHPKNRMERIVSNICAAHRTGYELSFLFGHPTLVNHPDMTELIRSAAAEKLASSPQIVPVITLAGEDFSEFASRVPGVFCFIGACRPGTCQIPHHNPCFDIDEEALPIGVELLVKGALRFFENADQIQFLKKEVG